MNTSYSNSTARDSQHVRSSSKEAFHRLRKKESYLTEAQITALTLGRIQPATRRMLSVETGYPVNKITQYTKELLLKQIVVESREKKPCQISGQKAFYLRLRVEKSACQSKLFDDDLSIDLSLSDKVRKNISSAPGDNSHDYVTALASLERADQTKLTPGLHDLIAEHPTLSNFEKTCLHAALNIRISEAKLQENGNF